MAKVTTETQRGRRADPNLAAFGALLRDLRERLGISQRELGRKVGLPHHFINRLESGLLPQLDLRDAVKLANFLGVSLETIAALTGADIAPSQEVGELSRQLATIERRLDAEQRRRLAVHLEPIFAYWSPGATSEFHNLVQKHFGQLMVEKRR